MVEHLPSPSLDRPGIWSPLTLFQEFHPEWATSSTWPPAWSKATLVARLKRRRVSGTNGFASNHHPPSACPREEPRTPRGKSLPLADIPLRVAWFRPGARTNPFPARARKGTDSGLASKLLAERLEDGKVLNAFFLGLHLSPPGSGTGRTPPDALAFPPSRNHLASRMPPT